MDKSTDDQALAQIGLFSHLDPKQVSALYSLSSNKTFPKNSIIINEGDETDSLFLIREGRVKIFLSDEDGKEVVLRNQGPGEYFGELALIDNQPRSASVMTLEKSKMSVISRTDFLHCLKQNPDMAIQLLLGLTKRFRQLTDNVRSLALLDVYGRVARLLLELSEDEDDVKVVREKLTHQEIANRVGASREMITRILSDLNRGGYISIKDRQITILGSLPHAW